MAEARELTSRAAARVLGVDPRTVIRLCDNGDLRCRVVHGPFRRRIYIAVVELRRYRESKLPRVVRT